MKTIDISGFGGGYEHTCQQMLKNGLGYIAAHPDFDAKLLVLKNVYGLAKLTGPHADALEDAVMKGIDDATGAMHQAVMSHLFYIAKHGREKWLEQVSDGNADRIYDWDGTLESCGPAKV